MKYWRKVNRFSRTITNICYRLYKSIYVVSNKLISFWNNITAHHLCHWYNCMIQFYHCLKLIGNAVKYSCTVYVLKLIWHAEFVSISQIFEMKRPVLNFGRTKILFNCRNMAWVFKWLFIDVWFLLKLI